MKVVYWLTYVLAIVFIAGETSRRGLGYFAVNATTMIEDYLAGAMLLWAALSWSRKQPIAPKLMAGAWGFCAGGMFVPFAAHLEAWLRGATFRPDHPHEDISAIVVKGVIWAICVGCLFVCLRSDDAGKQVDGSRSS